MGIPRWFESTLYEAQEANRPVDFSHLGEQFGLRIEEVVPLSSLSGWWALTKEWSDPARIDAGELGDVDRKVVAYLEDSCPACMEKIPNEKRPEFLRGLWKKKG